MKKTLHIFLVVFFGLTGPARPQICPVGFPLSMPSLGSLPSLGGVGLNLPVPSMSLSLAATGFPNINAALPSLSGLALPALPNLPGAGWSLPNPSFSLPGLGLGGGPGFSGPGLPSLPSMNLPCLGLCCG